MMLVPTATPSLSQLIVYLTENLINVYSFAPRQLILLIDLPPFSKKKLTNLVVSLLILTSLTISLQSLLLR